MYTFMPFVILAFALSVGFSIQVGAEIVPPTSATSNAGTKPTWTTDDRLLEFNDGVNPTSSDDYVDTETDYQDPATTQPNPDEPRQEQADSKVSEFHDHSVKYKTLRERYLRHRLKQKQLRQRSNKNQVQQNLHQEKPVMNPQTEDGYQHSYQNKPHAIRPMQGQHLAKNVGDIGSKESTNWNTDEQMRPRSQDEYTPRYGDYFKKRRRPETSQIPRGVRKGVHFTPLGMAAPVGPIFVKKRLQRRYGKYFTAKDDKIRFKLPTNLLVNCWMQAMVGKFSPSCNEDGTYSSKQCLRKRCWCTDRRGKFVKHSGGLHSNGFYFGIKALTLEC